MNRLSALLNGLEWDLNARFRQNSHHFARDLDRNSMGYPHKSRFGQTCVLCCCLAFPFCVDDNCEHFIWWKIKVYYLDVSNLVYLFNSWWKKSLYYSISYDFIEPNKIEQPKMCLTQQWFNVWSIVVMNYGMFQSKHNIYCIGHVVIIPGESTNILLIILCEK